jgi:hypothetical protein
MSTSWKTESPTEEGWYLYKITDPDYIAKTHPTQLLSVWVYYDSNDFLVTDILHFHFIVPLMPKGLWKRLDDNIMKQLSR